MCVPAILSLLGGLLRFRAHRDEGTTCWVTTCPVAKAPAIIEVAPLDRNCASARVQRYLRVKDCSVWPRHQDCPRECVEAITPSRTVEEPARR